MSHDFYRNDLRADAALEIEILSLSASTETRDFGFGPSVVWVLRQYSK
jgi:hypothetical protein